ncbi:MAG TPA: AAA family ATPase [Gemmataceae bacterium]|nr:AAA family ATPase [Gemmataceae bacterium]
MFPPCPQPPDWSIDWSALDPLPWLQDMKGCPQNPDRHAEGDVWVHVHLVCEAMAALPSWRELPEADRRLLFMAALLHDVAKPACTRIESDGRVSARGHSWRGAVLARRILWRLGVPFADREAVCAIVRHHLVPFFLAGSDYPRRLAIEVSQTVRSNLLAIMAEADVRGRDCPDPQRLFDQIALFREEAIAAGCLTGAYPFPSDHARFLYFHDPERSPISPDEEQLKSRVVLLSGLPAAGKDHWLTENLPDWAVVSVDAIRQELGVSPAEPQGDVLNRAREQARVLLQSGHNFVWNAPNLSRKMRGECIRMFHQHDAHVRIVYVEVPSERLFAQNRQRRGKVPEKVIERLLDRWEVPDRTEGHQVEYVVHSN